MARLEPHDVRFFATTADLRGWLEANHASATELWIGFWPKTSGRQTMPWADVVDELLCFGWIDSVLMPFEGARAIRVTPRRRGSPWSDRNVGRVEAMRSAGRMTPAGEAAFALRPGNPAGVGSPDRPSALDEAAEARLRADAAAFAWWEAQPQGYRRAAAYWVMSAKRPETLERRLARLVEGCAAGGRLVEITGREPARNG